MSVNFTRLKILYPQIKMKTLNILSVIALSAGLSMSCSTNNADVQLTKSGLNPDNFSAEYRGEKTELYTLTNANGAEVCITNFGGRIVSLSVPDRDGQLRDVVLGFDSIQAYFPENNQSDFGAAIGRYANRINQGRFTLDGVEYQLPQNNFGHCLHGGTNMGTMGWQYRVYNVDSVSENSLHLSILSPDADNNFPGAVKACVSYTLTGDNAIDIKYSATTDAPTIINLTNHSYFNLSGDANKQIVNDELTINAANYTPVDSTYMTTGEIAAVEGTPMDFRTAKLIGAEIGNVDFEQIKNGNGYDHNWVLDNNCDINVEAAQVYCPESGIVMKVYTTEPGVQVYTGNFLDGTVTGKKGIVYNQRTGICLETQHYPDSPNKADWPSVVLRPGEIYSTQTIYKFSTK